MGKTNVAFVVIGAILALCCSSTLASREITAGSSSGRGLLTIPTLEEVRATCTSSASAVLFVTGGSGQISASTVCSAYAAAISSIERIWEEYVVFIDTVPNDYCVRERLDEVISNCARAIASVYTAAHVEVTINGSGFGCAQAFSQGDAYARAFSGLLVNLWLGITDGISAAEADIIIGALEFAIAEVWSQSQAAVCQVNSGSDSDDDTDYATQIVDAITCIWAEVVVELCRVRLDDYAVSNPCDICDNGNLDAYVTETRASARGETCSSVTVVVDESSGNAGTGPTSQVKGCENRKADCCKPRFADSTLCLCGRNCRLTRDNKDDFIWEDRRDNSRCSCKGAQDVLG